MRSNGIGVFKLESIIVFIFAHSLIAALFAFYVGIILGHSLIQEILLLISE